jgi:lactate dehydrogenase-like 2-hydroxyacid dehydrogenase
VNERAVVEALRGGRLAGAALDVFEHEPEVTVELLSFENVVVTPHLGSATRATREAMGLAALDSLRSLLLDGLQPRNTVTVK